jgi:glycosyltransferase involved in cell wall biosynthesis
MESVRRLSRPFDEVLFYDDGSTDNTRAVASSLGITIVDGERNRGPSAARNELLARAQCEWVHFHDADDVMDGRFLEAMLPHMCDGIDVVVGDVDWVDEDRGGLHRAWRFLDQKLREDPVRYLIQHPLPIHATVYRRSLLEEIGGFDETLRCWEDGDINVRVAMHGGSFRALEETLATSFRHTRGASRNRDLRTACRLSILTKYSDALGGDYAALLAREAEEVAVQALRDENSQRAAEAIALCKNLGGRPPTTANPFLKAARLFLPPLTLLRLQAAIRQRA